MKRSQLGIGLSMLAVFLSGILVGAFGFGLYNVHTASVAPRVSPDDYRRKFTQEMKTRLQLSEGQSSQLEVILDDTRARVSDLRKKHKPEFTAVHDDQVQKIHAMLNPTQATEYDKYLQEREREKKARENGQRP